tara:strand:- start:1646 stop:2422 length:777 start_codon:yes stop_codon:yes gene_type:complete
MPNPFDVLGLHQNASWNQIRSAYKKMLVSTHPDKHGGNSKYFMMVHEAYGELEKQYAQAQQQRKAPTTKQRYEPMDQESMPEPKRVPQNRFNEHFDQNAIHMTDPFRTGGYGRYMSESKNYQEDESVLRGKKVHVPERGEVVIYKEPQALHTSSGWMQNYAEFGVDHVDDYTCKHGTDYQKAYTDPEECVDTRAKYQSIDALRHERENTNMKMTREEKKYRRQQEEDNARLEQYRRKAYRNDVNNVHERYVQLNNRLM